MSTVATQIKPSSNQEHEDRILTLSEECQNLFIEFYTEYALITIGPQVSLEEIDAPLLWRLVEWGSRYGLDSSARSPVLNHTSKNCEIAHLTESTLKCLSDALILGKAYHPGT